jgi:hypothetical protein
MAKSAFIGLVMEIITVGAFGICTLMGEGFWALILMWFRLPGMALLDASQLHLLKLGESAWWAWLSILLVTGWLQWFVLSIVAVWLASSLTSFASFRSKALPL